MSIIFPSFPSSPSFSWSARLIFFCHLILFHCHIWLIISSFLSFCSILFIFFSPIRSLTGLFLNYHNSSIAIFFLTLSHRQPLRFLLMFLITSYCLENTVVHFVNIGLKFLNLMLKAHWQLPLLGSSIHFLFPLYLTALHGLL